MKYQLQIESPGSAPAVVDLNPGGYIIGRDPECQIRLRHELVSGRHARILLSDDECTLDDLGSSNGTFTNGSKVSDAVSLSVGQQIEVGPFMLCLLAPEAQQPAAPEEPATTEPPPAPAAEPEPAPVTPPAQAAASPIPQPAGEKKPRPDIQLRRQVKTQIHKELVKRLDIKRLSASRIGNDELERRAKETIRSIVADVRNKLPPAVDPEALGQEIFNEAMRLGPLEDFLEDESITEVMINGPHQVYVERAGRLELTDQSFMDDASVHAIIERIVAPLGRRIDESSPYVDARLPDGSRVNAIIHPLSLIGPCLTIRKFSKRPYTDKDLIGFDTFTQDMAEFMQICLLLRKNIVVSGGTGSGKTTLLNVLGNYLPASDRILTIEDAAELRLVQPHVVRLEARPPNIEGRGAITIRDLVRNSLRMRPDRIIVGECRGGEALDMLQAMNTGHDGSLTTVHANSPRDVISRLETMVMMAGMDLPSRAIREQIASAVDIIVHESRFSDGSRRVTYISEIVGQEGEQITMQDIFEFRQSGLTADGKVVGEFVPTGAVPTFLQELEARGLSLRTEMFDPSAAKGSGA